MLILPHIMLRTYLRGTHRSYNSLSAGSKHVRSEGSERTTTLRAGVAKGVANTAWRADRSFNLNAVSVDSEYVDVGDALFAGCKVVRMELCANSAGRTSPAECRALRSDVGVDGAVEPSLASTKSVSECGRTHHRDQSCAQVCPLFA
jgi:hypothetical protein